MSTPPSVRGISKADLGEGVPEWTDKLLQPLNQFMSQTGDGLSGNLTTQNLAWAFVDVTVIEGQPVQSIAVPKLKGRTPKGVSVERVQVLQGGAIPTGPVGLYWTPTSVTVDGNAVQAIAVQQVYGLASGTRATLTLLVKAE